MSPRGRLDGMFVMELVEARTMEGSRGAMFQPRFVVAGDSAH